jgi:hypothetical protein
MIINVHFLFPVPKDISITETVENLHGTSHFVSILFSDTKHALAA